MTSPRSGCSCVARAVAVVSCIALVVAAGLSASAAEVRSAPAVETPQLIVEAQARGDIDRATANLYLAYAVTGSELLPERFRGTRPWDATSVILSLQRALARMKLGPQRAAIRAALGRDNGPSPSPGTGRCWISAVPQPETLLTPHFYIEYNPVTIRGGLTIDDYAESLEGAWRAEVTRFGWAAPPIMSSPVTKGRYHVRIDELPRGFFYGYVSDDGTYAGRVGNNPATPWDDQDAYASCMVLNSDFEPFAGTAQAALDATVAHEFNHSIQFGYGALSGANAPDSSFVEGGATWMEDEVYDHSDDNYNYLWPDFDDDMGDYDASPYPYWITWRGLTERYGTGAPGGGEQVMQTFWELISKGKKEALEAMSDSLASRGTDLADAYHAYAIAAKFNRKCGGGYSLPYCFEEGPGYVQAAGLTPAHAILDEGGDSHDGVLPDHYSLNWIAVPNKGNYDLVLENTAAGGRLRASVVCDTDSRLEITAFPRVADPGDRVAVAGFDASRCASAVVVVTNEAQTDADPAETVDRSYRISLRA